MLIGWIGLAAPAQAAEPGDEIWIGENPQLGAGGSQLFPIFFEGNDTDVPDMWAYCIEHDVPALTGAAGVVGDLDDFLGENYFAGDASVQVKVFWVIAHSYPALDLVEFAAAVGVESISVADAVQATQYAIWRYTDLTFDGEWGGMSATSKQAYEWLLDGARDVEPESDVAPTVSITAPAGDRPG